MEVNDKIAILKEARQIVEDFRNVIENLRNNLNEIAVDFNNKCNELIKKLSC